MSNKTRDDITALCSHARIDEQAYKLFPGVEQKPKIVVQGTERALRSGDERQVARRSRTFAILEESTGIAETPGRKLPAKPLTLYLHSPVGGAGKTTLLATLARIYAARGRNVLLIDDSRYSMLPFYFGGKPDCPGIGRFAALRDARSGSIQILANDAGDADWLEKGIAEQGLATDYVLVDKLPDFTQENAMLDAARVFVVILACDMSSALCVRRTLETFGARGDCKYSPLFVLNRFDPNAARHLEIRDWMQKELGTLLLPTAIRRAEEPAEALAEGLTVIDYAPDAPVTQDYLALADSLEQPWRFATQTPNTLQANRR